MGYKSFSVRSFGVRHRAAASLFRELARENFDSAYDSPPASWLGKKRQQAAALQSASRDGALTLVYHRFP
jgi:hypothetical protein